MFSRTFAPHRKSMTRGKTPITKNIRVIDAAGNEYEATYPKRAKGLVKNGRAIFIDEHTLCLDCPPNDCLEDKSMNNSFMQNAADVIGGTVQNAVEVVSDTAKNALEVMGLAKEAEDRSNGPMPSDNSKEWLKRIDIAAIVEHMESADIADFIKSLPADTLEYLDVAAIVEHMESNDIVELLLSLPDEQLKQLDIAEIVEHMESADIAKFLKRLFC